MTGMNRLCVPAPAKVDLFLHVTGRRADGYHLLETLLVAIDTGDTITLTRRDDGAIARTTEVLGVAAASDLAVRAAAALKKASGSSYGVDIALAKQVPVGGGMGGGSSDAASVLLALNRLWETELRRDELMCIGLPLGADVPFFLQGEPALARGIGEALTPVSLPPMWITVIVPSVAVATAVMFAAPELTRNSLSVKMDVFSEGYGRNDLETVACVRFPEIRRALEYLRTRSPAARMTGSGSCVFAPFAHEAEARAAVSAKPPEMRGFATRTLARHPLADFARG
jgi:4-diphosphocytidyl-2-C-methyl-D-erythritol kinase